LGRPKDCWFENSKEEILETYERKKDCPYVLDWKYDDTIKLDSKVTNEILTDICINATLCDSNLNYQLTNMPWYYCYKTYTYEPLVKPALEYDSKANYYLKSDIIEFNPKDSVNEYWKCDFATNPESLNFWFDFLDTDGELQNYNV